MVTAVASVNSIAIDKRLAGGVLHRTPSSAVVRSPSGASEQIHYHLSASSRNLLRAATIRNRHLPNGRHPRIRECAELCLHWSQTALLSQSRWRTYVIPGDAGRDWNLGCFEERQAQLG